MPSTTVKTERTTSKRLFTMANNHLMRAISDGTDLDIIQSRFNTLKNRWLEVTEKHAQYLTVAYPECDTDSSTEGKSDMISAEDDYIAKIDADYEESERAYKASMKSFDNPSTIVKKASMQVKQASRACRFERTTLGTTLSNLKAATGDKDTPSQVVKDAQEGVKLQLDRYRVAQREYVILLSDDEEVDKETTLMQEMQSMCLQENVVAGKMIAAKQTVKQEDSKCSKGMEWKMQRLEMPGFNGEIRDYLRFKEDFEKQVMPWIKKEQNGAYALRQCLKEEPLKLVKNVDDDMAKMWERLDDRYGRSSKLIDAVMSDIKQLKAVTDGEGHRFVDFVDTIETCHRNLKRINMESEICNSTIVSLIEEKLPNTIKTNWCLEVSDKE